MKTSTVSSDNNTYRPIPFYFVNRIEPEDVDARAIETAMRELRDSGFGGCVLFNKPPDGFTAEAYLEDLWFELVERFALSARHLDLQLWINDGFNFPPGDAGGRIQKIAPHIHQRRFARLADGSFEIVPVSWGFPAFEEPESSELFIQQVYERYYRKLGSYFGNGIVGFFSDADCRRFGPFPMDCDRYFPASRNILELFRNKFGEELWPHLDDIWHDRPTSARAAYWELAAELYRQWFRNNYDWCRKHGVKYSFHTSDTGPYAFAACPRSSIFTEGDFLSLAACCDYPGTDHELAALNGGRHFHPSFYSPRVTWGGVGQKSKYPDFSDTHGDVRAKYTSSAAYMHGKTRTVCEAFAATNWGVSFSELRRIAAWQIMQGINFFIPHAVHHRFYGVTKYFAPPALTAPGAFQQEGIAEFNNWLSKWCRLAGIGSPVYEIAVIDPTRKMWRGESDGKSLFALCERLNQLPYGYLIVSEEYATKHAENFAVVLDPDKASELPVDKLSNDLSFSGTDDVHFMRRRLDDGSEFCLVANIWCDKAITGIVRFKTQEWQLELQPGEIAVLGAGLDDYRPAVKDCHVDVALDKWDVEWLEPNVIPLSCWQNGAGETRHSAVATDAQPLYFRWSNRTQLPPLELWLPQSLYRQRDVFTFNDQPLPEGTPVKQFDDDYFAIPLSGGNLPGLQTLKLAGNIAEGSFNNIFLKGHFDVELATSGEQEVPYRTYYALTQHLPEQMSLTLIPRRKSLLAKSWAEQGQLFYSGGAVISTTIQPSASLRTPQLRIPQLAGTAEIFCNGKSLGRAIWGGENFYLPEDANEWHLEIKIFNGPGNLLDEYRAPSGLLQPPVIVQKSG